MAQTKEVNARDLGINLTDKDDGELFKWFIASFLFGKPIQQDIAAKTYRVLIEKHQRDTPRKLGNCTWQEIVDMLGEGHYVRYDESTAERLLLLCEKLNTQYHGKISAMQESSKNREDFEKRLADFKGIGPKTVEIFMREAAQLWY